MTPPTPISKESREAAVQESTELWKANNGDMHEQPGYHVQQLLTSATSAKDVEIERLGVVLDHLLTHCKVDECEECSKICCPHKDEMHMHHDGCPSCVGFEQVIEERAQLRRENVELKQSCAVDMVNQILDQLKESRSRIFTLELHNEKMKGALERYNKVCATVLSDGGINISDWWDSLIEAQQTGHRDMTSTPLPTILPKVVEAFHGMIAYCEGDICYNETDIRNIKMMVKEALTLLTNPKETTK